MKSKILLVFLGYFAAFGSFAQGINFEHELTFEQALEKAKTEGKIVFMDCYTTWCGPCKKLSAETFTDNAVGEFFNSHFINLKMDMEKGEGPELSGRFTVRGYPTLLWINPDGSVKYRTMGFVPAEKLLNEAQKATDTLSSKIAVMRTEYNNGKRDINFLNDYLNTLALIGGGSDSILQGFINSLSSANLKNEKYVQTIFNATDNLQSVGLAYIMKNRTAVEAIVGEATFAKKVNTVADKALADAVIKKDEVLFHGAIKLLNDLGGINASEKIARSYMEYTERIGNWKMYDKYASEYVQKFGLKNDKELSDIAWNYYLNIEDKKQLEKAKKWAYTAVELKNNTENNTIYAYMSYKLGDLKEAELACDYALLRAKEDGGNDSSAKGLKALIISETAKK